MKKANNTEQKNRLATKWLFTKNKSCSCTMPGVWRAVSFCEGCAVIFHSPLGCAHVATLMDLGAQYRIIGDHQDEDLDAVPLIASNLQEKDSIFGGIEKLRSCIAYVMKTWQPRCLVIATSCVAGVIGDDVEQEAEDAERSYDVPVLCVPYGGFLGGEYSDGYFRTVRLIMERFIKPQPKVPGRVLLFGDQMGPCGQYAREVKRLLGYFDLEVSWQFPGYVPFAEWGKLSTASLLIPLSYAGQTQGGLEKTAAAWTERFDTPSIRDVYPVGWRNTCVWLRKIAAFVGDEAKAEAVIQQEERRLKNFVKSILSVTQNKKAVLGIGRGPRWYNPAETLNTMQRMQMEISAVILYDKLMADEKDSVITAVEEWKKSVRFPDVPVIADGDYNYCLEQADVLLTTDELPGNPVKQFFIPMVPLAGTDGELILMRTIYRLLCRYGNKGGIAYA
jgi:nitrogenase molybdenum-iron protein alpha chain